MTLGRLGETPTPADQGTDSRPPPRGTKPTQSLRRRCLWTVAAPLKGSLAATINAQTRMHYLWLRNSHCSFWNLFDRQNTSVYRSNGDSGKGPGMTYMTMTRLDEAQPRLLQDQGVFPVDDPDRHLTTSLQRCRGSCTLEYVQPRTDLCQVSRWTRVCAVRERRRSTVTRFTGERDRETQSSGRGKW